jgi:tRNA-2-methylthio-N6-dimethylallyladenosine synthase
MKRLHPSTPKVLTCPVQIRTIHNLMNDTLPQEPKGLYLETFGCQMNVSESEKIVSLLGGLGYQPVTDPALADLILLNTCSVRAKAESKVYDYLGRYRLRKLRNSRLIIGVGGCVAQQEGERLLKKVPYLDLVFGTHSLHLLPELVRAAERGERRSATDFVDTETRLNLFPEASDTGELTRFVTIMQGCDNFCSYCIVPYVRGREISRRSAEIIAEIREMADQGVREVTLLGQNVNSYGLKSSGERHFAELIRDISAIDGIERIRFTTSHPRDISQELIACFTELPKLCGHIHLPAQSGSDAVLAKMGRGYTRSEYLTTVAALRKVRPGLAVTGDFIVGFPGETEADLEETLSLLEEVRYADLFSFLYSERPETAAAGFPDQLSRTVKQQRLDRLQRRQREITREICEGMVGTVQQVLIEGLSKRGDQLTGRSDGNRIVNVAGDPCLIGRMVDVMISHSHPNSLLGELCREG